MKRKMISTEAVNSALALYQQACLNYYRTPCKELFDRCVDAERICIDVGIRRTELSRIRIMMSDAAEEMEYNEN